MSPTTRKIGDVCTFCTLGVVAVISVISLAILIWVAAL